MPKEGGQKSERQKKKKDLLRVTGGQGKGSN